MHNSKIQLPPILSVISSCYGFHYFAKPILPYNISVILRNRKMIFKLTNVYFLGPKNRQRFLCECRVDGYSYVGAGNSSNKKDAQINAAKDFVHYLVRQGVVPQSDVPLEVRIKLI